MKIKHNTVPGVSVLFNAYSINKYLLQSHFMTGPRARHYRNSVILTMFLIRKMWHFEANDMNLSIF